MNHTDVVALQGLGELHSDVGFLETESSVRANVISLGYRGACPEKIKKPFSGWLSVTCVEQPR